MLMLMRSRTSPREDDQGFTLIELLVVIIIIGILAAIAIPVFLNQRTKGFDAAIKADLRNAATSEETYLTENGSYTDVIADLKSSGFKYSDKANYAGQIQLISVTFVAAESYCLTATSASGKVFALDSNLSGFVAAC